MTESPVLHLVTVGRSLLGRLASALPALEYVLDPASTDGRGVASQLRDLTRDGYLDPTTVLPDGEAAQALHAADPGLAAEWTSLAAYRQTPHARPQEAVVYLASDTDDGLRAAVLLALHERGDRVRYLHDLSGGVVSIPDHVGDVTVARVPGLDFSARRPTAEIERTWQALGDLGYTVATTAARTGWSVVLHLSGGFKAAIPYLLVMAEGIRTRLRGTPADVTAVCVHESSLHDGEPSYLVDLPVRYLSDTLRQDLCAADALTRPNLRGQFTTDPVGTQAPTFTWAGRILTTVLRQWP